MRDYENVKNTYGNNEILINAEEIPITIRTYLLLFTIINYYY